MADLVGAEQALTAARVRVADARDSLRTFLAQEAQAVANVAHALAPGLRWRAASPASEGVSADAELTPDVRLHVSLGALGWWAEVRLHTGRGAVLSVHAKREVRELLSAIGSVMRAAAHAEERAGDFKGAEGGLEGSKAERDAWRVALDVLQGRAVRP